MKLNKITHLLLMALYAGVLAPVAVSAAEEEDEDEYDNPWATIQQVEYSKHVEVGAYYVTDDSLRMGQFNGADSQGTHAVLNLDLRSLNVTDDKSANFWNLKVEDAGLDSRYLDADFGVQGAYKAFVTYKEVFSQELFMNQASSLYSSGWGSNDFGAPAAEFSDVSSKLKRQNINLGIAWDFLPNWQLEAELHQEDKEGSRTRGSYRGGPAGGPAFLAEPVDAKLTEFDLALSYADSHYQASLSYSRSQWRNEYDAVDYVGFNKGNPLDQRFGVDPDNEFEQVKLNLAWMMTDKTRLYLYGSLGQATQDDDYIINSLGSPDLALPQPNLNGEVDYTDFKLALNHRFTSKLLANISYKNTDRDNKTAQSIYEYASLDGPFCFDSFRGLTCADQNTPLSWSSEEYAVDLTYRVSSMWSVMAGASYEEKERTSTIAASTDEDKYWAKVKFRPSSMVNIDFKYTYSDREPSSYVVEPIIRYDGTIDSRVADVMLRQSHKGPRELDRGQLNIRYTPVMEWSFGLGADLKREEFAGGDAFLDAANDLLGLKSMDTDTYTVDATYQPNQRLNMTLFYSYSDYQGEQDGGLSDGSATPWRVDFEDDASLLGFNIDWEIIKDILTLSSDISYMDVNQDISAMEATEELTLYQPIKSDETTVNIGLIYRLAPTQEVKLNYSYLRYENDDWQYFGLDPDTFSFTNQIFNDVGHGVQLAYRQYF